MNKKNNQLSFYSIGLYLFCARKWYYHYRSQLSKKTTYPLLFGKTVHRFIAYWLYRKISQKDKIRVFYYKELPAAIKSWKRLWLQVVEEEQNKIILPKQVSIFEYMSIGVKCIENYWWGNYNLPRPIAIEKSFKAKILDWTLVGIFDQLREVSMAYIEHHRPELIKNGQLIDGYDPVIIVDLKTNYVSYDTQQFVEEPSQEEELRQQFDLHENLQPTIYTWLYEQQTGKKPIGFVWYHLRSGRGFFTYREDKDYHNLLITIKHVQYNLMIDSFPKRTGKHCRQCDFFEACREERDFILSPPETWLEKDLVQPVKVATQVKKLHGKQLKLDLHVARHVSANKTVKRLKEPNQKSQIILYDLPWDDEI